MAAVRAFAAHAILAEGTVGRQRKMVRRDCEVFGSGGEGSEGSEGGEGGEGGGGEGDRR